MAKLPDMVVRIRKDVDARAFEEALEEFEGACMKYGESNGENYDAVLDARGVLVGVVLNAYVATGTNPKEGEP